MRESQSTGATVRAAFEARGLKPEIGPMSTQFTCEDDLIFAALAEAFAKAANVGGGGDDDYRLECLPDRQLTPVARVMRPGHKAADYAGEFGPEAYATWRATSLGTITEDIERRLILRLAGQLRGRAVLDVGCGDGALTLTCWRNGASPIVGCDIDPRMIARSAARAAQQKATIAYAVGRAETLPFRDQSFDLVTAITVLAFVPEPVSAVREIARVLRPGGRLVIGDLGKWSLWAAARRLRGWFGAEMWNAAKFRSASELRALVEVAKLRVDHVTGAVYYPRSRLIARLIAPIDPVLGELTTFGAAFLAVEGTKE